jgi:hypothetical protein
MVILLKEAFNFYVMLYGNDALKQKFTDPLPVVYILLAYYAAKEMFTC